MTVTLPLIAAARPLPSLRLLSPTAETEVRSRRVRQAITVPSRPV